MQPNPTDSKKKWVAYAASLDVPVIRLDKGKIIEKIHATRGERVIRVKGV